MQTNEEKMEEMKAIPKQNKWKRGKKNASQPLLAESGPPIIVKEKVEGVRIYVDGACQPNPGKGGYAFAVIENDEVLHEFNRMVEDTTNNRMEMSAIIDALQWVLVECPNEPITILTDSEYCHKGITIWHKGWEMKQYEGVKNKELWQEMVRLKRQCINVQYTWVRGHNGNRWNEYVDRLAVAAVTGVRQEDKLVTWFKKKEEQSDKQIDKCNIVGDIIAKMILNEDERVISLAREALMGKTIDQLKQYQ